MDNNKLSMRTNLRLPPIIYGTSSLGNLFVASTEEQKRSIVSECLRLSNGNVVFDSAGKYGAGLALEMLGSSLKQLQARPEDVLISNKLGWLRVPLQTPEPTFEPGVWKDLSYDAVQKISYDGILECYEQGNTLLGEYKAQLVSVHDPDEYLATAKNAEEDERLFQDILEAYRALQELKKNGHVSAIGVGAKDWRVIARIAQHVSLDWVMIANSMTVKSHPSALLAFIQQMEKQGVYVINSAVFHSGFLVGSNYFDYREVTGNTPEDNALLTWREEFFRVCDAFDVTPAAVCVQFALHVPGVRSIALNTTDASRIQKNLALVHTRIPNALWKTLYDKNLITYPLESNGMINESPSIL
jgi:D-threo-aldose 1-dehydrogenase